MGKITDFLDHPRQHAPRVVVADQLAGLVQHHALELRRRPLRPEHRRQRLAERPQDAVRVAHLQRDRVLRHVRPEDVEPERRDRQLRSSAAEKDVYTDAAQNEQRRAEQGEQVPTDVESPDEVTPEEPLDGAPAAHSAGDDERCNARTPARQ